MRLLSLFSLTIITQLFIIQTSFAQTTQAKIAVGASQSLVLKEDGSVFTFGSSFYGVLGQGNAFRGDIPTELSNTNYSGKSISAISTSKSINSFSLMLATDGSVYGFGNNEYGQLGLGNTTKQAIPTLITHAALDTATIIAVSAGKEHSLLLSDKGTVFVMGPNSEGYLGVGYGSGPILTPTPINMAPLAGEKVVKISAGLNHSLALTESNHLFAWGQGINGQLGDSTNILKTSPVQVPEHFFDGKTITDMIAFDGVSMALTSDGTVYSWGHKRGFLGRVAEEVTDIRYPKEIDTTNLSGKTIIGMSKGDDIGFLLASDGSVFSFGANVFGSLGFGDKSVRAIATQIPPENFQNKPIVEVEAGMFHTLFRAQDGTMFGVGGQNDRMSVTGTGYQGRFLYKPLPINTANLAGKTITNLVAGQLISLALTTDGTVFSFGGTEYPHITQGNIYLYMGRTSIPILDTPTLLNHANLNGKTIVDVKAGGLASFLLTDQGEVFAFGRGSAGNLGLGDSLDVFVPTLISHSNLAGKHIIDVSSSMYMSINSVDQAHTLLLADDGTVFSMGSNGSGQLGFGDFVNRFVPTQITHPNLDGKFITKIVANALNSILVASDGSVFIWGEEYGNTNTLNVPTLYTHANLGGKAIKDAALGLSSTGASNPHFLLLAEDSTVYSFGYNSDGQLGIGTKITDSSNAPTQVAGGLAGKKVVSIKAGYVNTSMALTSDGKIYSWGNVKTVGFNVGNYTDSVFASLVRGTDLDKRFAINIAVNEKHSLALMQDGTLMSFGTSVGGYTNYGAFGTGGNGTYSDQKLPVKIPDFTTKVSSYSTTNLVLHLDAGSGAVRSGDALTNWYDKSGLANNAWAEVGLEPTVSESAINGKSAVHFNGTKYVALPTTANLGIQNNDYEMFIVAKSSSANIQFLMGGETLGQHELHLNGDAGVRFIPVSNSANFVDVGVTGDFTNGAAQLFNVQATQTSGRVSVNRSPLTLVNASAHSANAGFIYLGKRTNDSYFFNGDIAEVIIFNNVLNTDDRNQVETYLFKKYAIQNYAEKSVSITGSEGWRLLSSPAKDSTYGSFFRDIWTQGITGADYESGSANIFSWNTADSTNNPSNWTALSSMDATYPIGSGSLVYVFSDDDGSNVEGNAGFPKTFTTDGLISSSDLNLNSVLNQKENGWALIGNPFTTDMDWDLVSSSNLTSIAYVWDPNASSWKTWNGSVGSLTDGIIGPLNAFFVQSNASNPSLTIPTSSKVSSSSFIGKRSQETVTALRLQVSDTTGLSNEAWVQFSESGEFGIDQKDALKLAPFSNTFVQIGTSLADGTVLDINHLPIEFGQIELPLEVKSSHSGVHRLGLERSKLPTTWVVQLKDHQTGEETNLDETYSFIWTNSAKQVVIDSSNKPEVEIQSQMSTRFSLLVTAMTTSIDEQAKNYDLSLNQNYPNPFNPSTTFSFSLNKAGVVKIKLYDVLGRLIAEPVSSLFQAGNHSQLFNASSLSSGMYFYRMSIDGKVFKTMKMTLIK